MVKSLTAKLSDTEVHAVARLMRVSPQKLNLVAGMIRGKPVAQALTLLAFSRKRIAGDVHKLVSSAIANAENNRNLDIDRLYVREAWVGKTFTMKRMRPRARGRSARIQKPFSRLTVVLKEKEES